MPLDPTLTAMLRETSVPSVVSTLYRMGYRNVFLRAVRGLAAGAPTMVGTAYTLRTVPMREDRRAAIEAGNADNLQKRAFEEVAEGEVLVCEAAGVTETALLGDMVVTAFKVRGVAGIVVDGGVNDRAAIEALGFPVYAAGDASLPFTSHRHITAINEPVDCGGVAIFPGDVLVGDRNGVAAIPAALVEEVARTAHRRERLEAFCAARLRAGAPLAGTYPPDEATVAAFEATEGL